MASNTTTFRATTGRVFRRILPWALALAVATCTDDQNGPSAGGTGYFSFRPVYGISNSLSQFGIVADSVHVTLTRPVNQVVLDTTVFFPPDSTELRLALPIHLEQSPETLAAVIEIKSGSTLLFVDSVNVQVLDGPPNPVNIPTVVLDYVGPGKNVAAITLAPTDTTIVLGDTLFFTASAIDSSAAPVASFFVAWKTSDTTVAKINAAGRLIAPNLRGSVQVIGYTPTGIADTTLVTFAPVPVVITADSGNAQSGLAGDSLGNLFVARVKGADSLGISGIAVRFASVTAGGTVRDTATLTTDAQGRVKTRGVLGITAGAYSYSATVVGTGITRTFTATATAGAASAIAIQSGNAQVDSAGRALPLPLTVRVADAFNNPVAGAKVYWTRTAGTGLVALDSSNTNGSGLATTGYTLGNVGLDSIRAALAGTSAFVDFSATAINGAPATVLKNFGDAQTDTVGRLLTDSLVVIVRSATAKPVVGTPVVWTVLRGGATSDDTLFTDAAGRAAVAYTLGTTTGIDSVRAQAGAASAIFTETAVTGLATTLSLVSGDAQTDTTDKTLPLPFVVHAVDAFGNNVSGTPIAWATTFGNGSVGSDTVLTNGAGNASNSYTLGSTAGTDTITASLVCGCSTVTFTATALSAAPASIVTVQGDSQTVVVNTVADTFAVLVRDGASNPVAGVKVNWAFIPAQGSFTEILPAGIQQSFTDSLGVARGIYTAGTSAGTVRVEAQIGPIVDSIFVFAVPAAPTVIAIQSGDLQSDTVGNAIPQPFVARVRDAFGNPVAGAMVLFTRIAGSGTLFADSVATNASGDASVGYLFGLVPGVDTIRATLSGTAAFVDFQATALAATPASISSVSGSGQVTAVTLAYAESLMVEVLDGSDNPIVNGAVVWTLPTGGGSLSADTTFTDINGRTFVRVTAGTVAGSFTAQATPAGTAINTSFSFSVTAGAASAIALFDGDAQVDTIGATLPLGLAVTATDLYGNPVQNAAVTFVRTAGTGSVVLDTALTDVAGQAATGYTLGGTPGTDSIVATLVGTASTVTFTATAVNPVVASVTDFVGDGTSDTVGAALFTPLTVTVRGAGAQPVLGASIAWTVLSGGGTVGPDTTVTDVSGRTSTTFTLGGTAGTALVEAKSVSTGIADTFTVTQLADAPSAIVIVSGSGQTDTTGRTLPLPFVVGVTDAFGNPSIGAKVVFQVVAGNGNASGDTVFTDLAGLAQVNFTLGITPAADTIRASLFGTSAFVDFSATSISGSASLLAKLLGDNQTDTVFATLTDSLVVQLVDGTFTPVPNTWIYWVAGGATLSADSTQTDINGKAAVQVTLGGVAVPVSVIAFNVDTTVATGFTLHATAGTATQITAVSGLGQTDAVNTPLPIDFGAFVQDAYGNPVGAGVAVTWTNLAGFTPAGLPDTTLTDSTSVAFLTAPLLGAIAGEDSLVAQILGQPATATFTATATAGAASSLVYVSGTGQTDTVGRSLSAPMVVQVRDAASNPVAGAWVQWTIISGSGAVPLDSTQTDAAGAASSSLTMGTVAGLDSISATFAGVTDTVVFYAVAENDTAAAIGISSGDGQSATIGAAVAQPVIAQVQDQYGNGVDGITVTFTPSGSFGSVANPSVVTDANGQASSGTWTLDSLAGTNTLLAAAGALNATAGAFALPIGTSKYWNGLTSTDWNTAANWSPVGVPTASDNVFIPVSQPAPVLSADGATNDLTLQGGGSLDVGSNTLTVNGSLYEGGATMSGGGAVVLAGSGTIDQLNAVAVHVDGSYTLTSGAVAQAGYLQIGATGTLDLNGHALVVLGNMSQGGRLVMQAGSDSLDILGTMDVSSSQAGAGDLTNGILVLRGDLSVTSGAAAFQSSGAHRTLFAGTGAQTIDLGAPANQFQDLEIRNAGGVTLASNIAVAGNAVVSSGTLSGPFTALVAGGITDATNVSWAPTNTFLTGTSSVLPDSFAQSVRIEGGNIALAKSLVVRGQFSVAGTFTLNGFTLRVDSIFTVTSGGQFQMLNGADTLDVAQTITWDGSTAAGLLTDGTIIARGDFRVPSASAFQASSNHVVILAGTTSQTIDFAGGSGPSNNQFRELSFQNPAGVDLASGIYVSDNVSVDTGTVTGAGIDVGIGGTLLAPVVGTWLPSSTTFTGSPASFPDTLTTTLRTAGAASVTLTKDLRVMGAFAATSGSFDLGGHTLQVDSTFDLSGPAAFIMQNPLDSLVVAQGATWDGGISSGLLTAGTAIFRGDFTEASGSQVYQATGTHTTVFAGSGVQTVYLAGSSLGVNQFQNLSFQNADTVNFIAFAIAAGDVTALGGPVTGGTLEIYGGLTVATDTNWIPGNTRIAGNLTAFPDTILRSLEVTGSLLLPQSMYVGQDVQVTGNGVLTLNGHTLRVDSTLAVNGGSAQVNMNDAADTLDVGGATVWAGDADNTHLTAGVLVLHGSLSTGLGGPFKAGGTHKTVIADSASVSVSFINPGFGGASFQELELGPGAVIIANSDIYVNGTATKLPGAVGTLFGNTGTQTLHARGMAAQSLNVTGMTLDVQGNPITTFDDVSFNAIDPTATAILMMSGGTASPATWNNIRFNYTPSSGYYISATDSNFNESQLVIRMYASTPLDGSAYTQEVGAFGDGVSIDWSSLSFQTPPTNVTAGDTLAPVEVAVLDPTGAVYTAFNDSVTISLGTAPGGSTLSGTLTVQAVSGVATFSDLSIDLDGSPFALLAQVAGLPVLLSSPFNVFFPVPAGFNIVWNGATSSDWNDPANWSTGVAPDGASNVFIPVTANLPNLTASNDTINRLRIASGATLYLEFDATLVADSTIEAFGSKTGNGWLVAGGTGDITGDMGSRFRIDGSYSVAGNVNAGQVDVYGDLFVAADTLVSTGLFQTQDTGEVHMTDPAALIDVNGPAEFSGAQASSAMSDGTLRLHSALYASGATNQGFTPTGNHVTELMNAPYNLQFGSADTATGSYFNHVVVNVAATDTVFATTMAIRGDLNVNQGTLFGQPGGNLTVLGTTTIQTLGVLSFPEIRSGGEIVANGGTYFAPLTRYFGGGTPVPIDPLPYDTLVIQANAVVAGDFGMTGDLRIDGNSGSAGFDLNGHTVSVAGSVSLSENATLTMTDPADWLNVTGGFFTNGAATTGLLTDGLLQIGGDFRQAADGSGESFRASGNHTTRFTSGLGTREIKFDSPSQNASDAGGSHFAILDLPDGVDSINGRVPASVSLSIGGAVTYDSTTSNNLLASYGTIDILASSDSVHIQTLESWDNLTKAGAGLYAVGLTRLWGGSGTLPTLPYIDLSIANTAYTLGADQVIAGSLSLGIFCSEVCTSSPGELTVGGHTLTVGDQLQVLGLGYLTMGAGDSVDVTGDITFRGAPSDGHLTGGTLVTRGLFNTVGSDAFQADAAHRTVMLATGANDIYTTPNSWFGKLYLLDGGMRRIRSSSPLVVKDSLVLGSSTSGLSDTLGFGTSQIVAQGPVLTVTGSAIFMEGSVRFDDINQTILGGYSAGTTIFGGAFQQIPALPYQNIQVVSSALLVSPLDIGNYQFTVDGSAGPADLNLNGQTLQVGDFTTTGNATLTSQQPGSGLVVRGNALFNGGDETNKLSEGGITILGFFTQDSMTSLASYYSNGNHTTVFADSSFGGSQAVLSSMTTGASRFNQLAVYGRGVNFFGAAWIDGAVNILDPGLVDSVGGQSARLGAGLFDASYKWLVDTTVFLNAYQAFPDSIDGTVELMEQVDLGVLMRVGGSLTIHDTLGLGGGTTLRVGGDFAAIGNGLLRQTNLADNVTIKGAALFDGATATGWMTAGTLTVSGNFTVGPTNGFAFDATGTYSTILDGLLGQSAEFQAAGGGFQNLDFSNGGLTLLSDVLVRGDLTGSGEAPGSIYGNNHQIYVGSTVEQLTTFDNTRVKIPSSNQLFDVDFVNTDPTVDQLTVDGPGSPLPLQLNAIRFGTIPTTGRLVEAIDTVANGDSLLVYMMSSRPFTANAYGHGTGDARVAFGTLEMSTFPLTVDSAVPFQLTMDFLTPTRGVAGVSGSVTIALAANPNSLTLGGTLTVPILGGQATFGDLVLDGVSTGVSFFLSVDGQPTDTLTTGTLDVINPAPAGANIFTAAISNDWTDPGNWSTTTVPSPAEDVFIPGGVAVFIPPSNTYVVNTLVLGSGANLDLGLGSLLTVNGNVYAGQTITGPGTLVLASTFGQVSGSLPAVQVTGNVTAVGHTTINGSLVIDGGSAEFNVGGQRVDVSNTTQTINGGVLTMDGAADSLFTSDAAFDGGDETGRLTAGVLVIQGSTLEQSGPTPSAFMTGGSFTVVFGNWGDNTNVSLQDPFSSQFTHVQVQNPNGTYFGSSNNVTVINGDLTVSAGGLVLGDTLRVNGTITTAAPGDSIDLPRLVVAGPLALSGGYNVIITDFATDSAAIPALPYQTLWVNGSGIKLATNVDANTVYVFGDGLDLNAHTLHAEVFRTQDGGRLIMDDPADTLVADSAALFQGSSEGGQLTAGTVLLAGSLSAVGNQYQASPGHLTRFVGPTTHIVTTGFACEGSCPGPPIEFGTLQVDTGTVSFSDPSHNGVLVNDSLRLFGGLLYQAGNQLVVQNALVTDAESFLYVGQLVLLGSVDAPLVDTAYVVPSTLYGASGQTIVDLNYNSLTVSGDATLGADIGAIGVQVVNNGRLALGGHILTVSNDFSVTDNAHLEMHNAADSLLVAGTAYFQGEDGTGDLTAGGIRAFNVFQGQGPSASPLSLVETGSHRFIPMAGGSITMNDAGPGGSVLKTIDFSPAGANVTVQGLWVTDTLILNDNSTAVNAVTGFPFAVMGALVMGDGSINATRMAVGGTLDYSAGSYNVDTTVFAGPSGTQTIPVNVPYRDIEVQYAATLEGDLSLPDRTFTVANSGILHLGGFNLTLAGLGDSARFETKDLGVLVMNDPADSLTVTNAKFGGGDETGLLTDGVLQVGNFQQVNGAGTINTFVASGAHLTEFIDIGLPPGSGYGLTMDPDEADTASHFNAVSFLGNSGVDLGTNFYAAGALFVNNSLNGNSYSVTAAGPITVGNAAALSLDTLRVLSTLTVDPSATMNVANTVYGPAASAMPVFTWYQNVYVEGAQTLTTPIDVSGNLFVRGGGTLTPAGKKLSSAGTLYLQDNARLVMAPADTVEVAQANFNGAGSGSDLAGGILRIRNGLASGSSTSSQSFAPTGMVVEFYGGGTANIDLALVSPFNSYIDTLRVIEGTTISPQGDLLVLGSTVLQDGSTFDGNSSSSALDFRGDVSVLDTSSVVSAGSATLFFFDTLTMASPGNYSVTNTSFYNTNGIPDLPYQNLILGDGVHDTLTHSLSAANQMIITGSVQGDQEVVLNGNRLSAVTFDVGGYGRLVMLNPNDTLSVSGNVTFGGDATNGRLLAGRMLLGGDLTQNSAISTKSLAVDGTVVEFRGGDSFHNITFASPLNTESYLANVGVFDGDEVNVHSNIVITQGLFQEFGTIFRMTGSLNLRADIFGAVTFGNGSTFTANDGGGVANFYGTVTPGLGMSYGVDNTGFTNTNSLPDLAYTNLYLADGTFDTLTTTLNVSGELGISGTGPAAQELVLNGHTINAGRLTTSFYGQFTMQNSLDQLAVTGSAIFDGGNLSGKLTQGVIMIGDSLTQLASWSDKSFRSTGTLVQFPSGGPAHEISFNTPDSSYFADASGIFNSPLELNITGRMKATGTVGGYTTIITGDTLEVGTLSAGPGSGTVTLQKLIAGQILGSFSGYTVNTTQFNGNGLIPAFVYDTLILAGRDSITSGTVTANHISINDSTYVGPGATLVSNGHLIVDGSNIANKGVLKLDDGTVQVADSFITRNAGYLASGTGASSISAKNVLFNGGSETTHLTRGTLTVGGDFASGIGTSFDADSLFTVNFTGGGNHDLELGNPASQFFGELRVTASGPDSDTLYLVPAADVNTYRLNLTGGARVIGSALQGVAQQQLVTQQLSVSGATFQDVLVRESTFDPQPMQFDQVVFTGYSGTDIQLWIDHNGVSGDPGPDFTFTDVDFDDIAIGNGGLFVNLNNNGAASPQLNLRILGPDNGTVSGTETLFNATIEWFPPS